MQQILYMSQRYFIRFAYDGTAYHGWQIQPNAVSVQGVMTEKLQKLFGPEFHLVAAGRTDTGVHAREMFAHFDVPQAIEDQTLFAQKLDGMMPKDITVFDVVPVNSRAHARFDAISRTYEYWIGFHKDPFLERFFLRMHRVPDFDLMNAAANALFDYIDFTSFSKLHTDVKTNNCQIRQAFWEQRGDYWVFTIQADRFLRNMVRSIVGTLLDVGWRKLSLEDFRLIIERKDRCAAGSSMPPQGLFLTRVAYPDWIYDLTHVEKDLTVQEDC